MEHRLVIGPQCRNWFVEGNAFELRINRAYKDFSVKYDERDPITINVRTSSLIAIISCTGSMTCPDVDDDPHLPPALDKTMAASFTPAREATIVRKHEWR